MKWVLQYLHFRDDETEAERVTSPNHRRASGTAGTQTDYQSLLSSSKSCFEVYLYLILLPESNSQSIRFKTGNINPV